MTPKHPLNDSKNDPYMTLLPLPPKPISYVQGILLVELLFVTQLQLFTNGR